MHKIYLFANNPDVKKIINLIEFDENDIIVTFNICYLNNIDKFLNHKNKIHVFRKENNNKLFFYDKHIEKYNSKILIFNTSKYHKDEFKKNVVNFPYEYVNLHDNKIIYNELKKNNFLIKKVNSSPTTGLYGYLYFKNKYPESTIYLIGFTSDYSNDINKTFGSSHNAILEQTYYNNELIKNKNLIKIDNEMFFIK